MPAYVTAAARTPWCPRGGALAQVRPEQLLAAAIEAAVHQRALVPANIDRVLVACDTGVGAQALNIARRAILELGWSPVPALTIDGRGITDLGAMDLAARIPGLTVVAAVDVTSLVPPGANLVRDYGRPTLNEPEVAWLEAVAIAAGLSREQLDDAALRLRTGCATPSLGVIPIRAGTTTVATDTPVEQDLPVGEFRPLTGAQGLLTALHEAPLADGAAAVIVETVDSAPELGRRITNHQLVAGEPESLLVRLKAALGHSLTAIADPSAVIHQAVGVRAAPAVSPVLALGSAPSADGLRLLVDVFHTTDPECCIGRRGQMGQIAFVELAARSGSLRPYSET